MITPSSIANMLLEDDEDVVDPKAYIMRSKIRFIVMFVEQRYPRRTKYFMSGEPPGWYQHSEKRSEAKLFTNREQAQSIADRLSSTSRMPRFYPFSYPMNAAANIARALLEDEEDLDPKAYTLANLPHTKWWAIAYYPLDNSVWYYAEPMHSPTELFTQKVSYARVFRTKQEAEEYALGHISDHLLKRVRIDMLPIAEAAEDVDPKAFVMAQQFKWVVVIRPNNVKGEEFDDPAYADYLTRDGMRYFIAGHEHPKGVYFTQHPHRAYKFTERADAEVLAGIMRRRIDLENQDERIDVEVAL